MNFLTSTNKKQGFVILFTVLIVSVILLIASGIFGVTQQESGLTGRAVESQIAFYAADAALECALYHDGTNLGFTLPVTEVECAGEAETATSSGGTNPRSYEYSMDIGDGCATVIVLKDAFVDGALSTQIIARGFNKCDNGRPDVNDRQLAERVLRATYPG